MTIQLALSKAVAVALAATVASEKLLTLDDVADQLGVSSRTVRRLARTKALRHIFVGAAGDRCMRFEQAAIDEFKAARRT